MAEMKNENQAFLKAPLTIKGRKHKSSKHYLNQVLLALAASLGYFTIGLVRGYSSSAVPSMEDHDPHLVDSAETESWISAVPPLGACVGSLCTGPLLQRIGRKRTLMISGPLFVAGWVIISLAGASGVMVGGRMLTGFCAGIAIPSAQIYVSECSDPEVRGILGSIPALLMAAGILISYIMGAWLSWSHLAWASAVFPTIMIFVLLPLPESPPWLRAKGRKEEADKAHKWLHKHQPDEGVALTLVSTDTQNGDLADNEPNTPAGTGSLQRSPFSRKELFRRPVMIPLLLSLALLCFQQLSGIDAIVFYTVAIFRSAGSPLDDHVATIIVGLVQLVANSLSLLFIDKTGRRPLLIASGLLMSISMAALGTYFHLHELQMAEGLGLLPLMSLIVFMIGFSIGYCNIPFLLMGELLPARQRSLFSSFAGSINLGFMFVVIKTYPNLKGALGSQGAFWLYSAVCFLSCVFVWFLVPETKGKSLDEIEDYFELKHVSKRNKLNGLK